MSVFLPRNIQDKIEIGW